MYPAPSNYGWTPPQRKSHGGLIALTVCGVIVAILGFLFWRGAANSYVNCQDPYIQSVQQNCSRYSAIAVIGLVAFLAGIACFLTGGILLLVKGRAPRTPPLPPGWYTDPTGTPRWWDGAQWSPTTAPQGSSGYGGTYYPPPPSPPT